MSVYEQLWDVSYEYLEKHAAFVNSITSLMLERAKHLRCYLFSNGLEKRVMFQEDFKLALDELQKMTKTLQTVVNDWKDLFADESTVFGKQMAAVPLQLEEAPAIDLTFGYMKPTLDYQANQKLKLIVTYIPPIREDVIFYAMDESRKKDFRDKLMAIQKTGIRKFDETPLPGAVFMIYLDNLWHRVICNASVEDDKKALELYLLDLGETLPYEEDIIKASLPAELRGVPAFAMKCTLAPKTVPLPFQLYDSVDCSVVAIENDLLTVKHIVNEQGAPEYAITREIFTKEELEQLDDISSSTTNAMKAVLGYIPKDDEILCKHYDPDTKGCFKGASCRLRHEPKNPDGWTVEKDLVAVAIPAQMEIPHTNTYVTLYPTCVVDVDLFYAQVEGNEENYRSFQNLMAEMNDPEVVANYKPLKLMPALNELVVAKYDNVWFRAKVCEAYDHTVSVFYVDYGNTATVGTNEVRRWEERFKYVPYQAVCCRIANIQRIKPCHVEAIYQLQNYILDKPTMTLIIDNKYPWEVLIYGPDGDDIGKGLIMTKLALPRKPEKIDENSYIPG